MFFEPDTFVMDYCLKKGFRTPKTRDVDPEYYRKLMQIRVVYE